MSNTASHVIGSRMSMSPKPRNESQPGLSLGLQGKKNFPPVIWDAELEYSKPSYCPLGESLTKNKSLIQLA